MMKRLLASTGFLVALLLAPAAQAQYQFDYGGRTIRIDPDRGTVSIPGVYDNTGRRKRDRDHGRKPAPDQAKVDPKLDQPQATPAPTDQPPAAAVAPANIAPTPDSATATAAPTAAANTPATPAQQDAARSAPVVAIAPAAPQPAPAPPPPAPVQQQQAAIPASAAAPNSPLGLWLTEEKEGKVRIEQCGANLCGYSVDTKSNQNGEQVLINMKAGKDSTWSGRILDPNSGSTYDSTIAMKGTGSLRVQGCAFGGMFCGGQTWTRVN
jgi:uncharacterized protein (DUF2147 family)